MTRYFAVFALLAGVLLVNIGETQEGGKKFEPKCPVSGKAIDKEASVDFNGGKVYFCCENCPKAFSQNTEKFAAKANLQLVGTGQAKQIKCPFSGRDMNPDATVTISEVTVKFCCENCQGKAQGMQPNEQVNAVFNEKAFKKGFEVKSK